MSVIILLFHLVALCKAIFTLYWHYNYAPHKKTYGGDWTYLTYICMQAQMVLYLLCVVVDILNFTKGNLVKWRNYRDNFFAVMALPLSIIVSILFWSLYFVNRELVYPKALDAVIPTWYNHLMHTTIPLFMVVEAITSVHHFPSRKKGTLLTVLLSTTYLVWIHFSFYMGGTWPYNILYKLKGMDFNMFCGFSIMLSAMVYLAGDYLNGATNYEQWKMKSS